MRPGQGDIFRRVCSAPFPAAVATALLLFGSACGPRPRPDAAPPAATVVRSTFVSVGSPAPSVHASTLAADGDAVVIAWFAGPYESHPEVAIWLTRCRAGTCETPRIVASGAAPDGRRYPTWNPVLFRTRDGALQLYYKVGPNPREWWGMRMRSTDGGRRWSAPERLPDGILGPIKDKPVPLASGRWVSPSSTEAPDSANAWRVHFELSDDDGRTWRRTTPRRGPVPDVDAIQPTILRHADGRLQALARTRGPGRIAVSWSEDDGESWSPLGLTDLPNPNSGLDAVTLRDGRHLLIYNHASEGRTPLNLAISRDGVRWTPLLTLESEPGEYSYPAIIEGTDGTIHATWTWKRQRIRHMEIRLR